jgi:Type II secretion system (T2SS), protein M
MFDWIDNVRQSWDNLSERERRLLSALGGVFAALVVFGSVYTATSALSEVEEDRDAIRLVLADIDRSAELLAKRDAERKAIDARFSHKAPALAAYLEGRAKDEGIEVRNVDEEQAKTTGIYRRQAVRANFANVPLRPVVHLLTSIAEEAAPLSVERLVIEHYAAGDSYKIDMGLASYEKQAKAKAEPKPMEQP